MNLKGSLETWHSGTSRHVAEERLEQKKRKALWYPVWPAYCFSNTTIVWNVSKMSSVHLQGVEKKAEPDRCLHHGAASPAFFGRGGSVKLQLRVQPCRVCVQYVTFPRGQICSEGCKFSWTGKLFLAHVGWRWCHKCFLILRAQVKFSPRDSPEFSCCSGRGGRGVEPTEAERRAGGAAAVALSVASLPF